MGQKPAGINIYCGDMLHGRMWVTYVCLGLCWFRCEWWLHLLIPSVSGNGYFTSMLYNTRVCYVQYLFREETLEDEVDDRLRIACGASYETVSG